MNNTEKLIASQYLVKQAIFGALLRGAGSLASGFGKQLGSMGSFFKQNPIKATAVTAGSGLVGSALADTVSAMAGNEPAIFKNVGDTPLVKGFREISNTNPFLADLMVAGNPILAPAYFTQKIFGKSNPSKSPPIGPGGKYRGPQDFKPGLRAPTLY